MKKLVLSIFCYYFLLIILTPQKVMAQIVRPLKELQQQFVDLKFGMFIHFNIGTFYNYDWPDPDADISAYNPNKLDCTQWAEIAKSSKMRYGCLTTKHHSGFCNWNTKTTKYNVMYTPLARDVVKEYTEAFRQAGLKVMLYYSILDTHHKIRPGFINSESIKMIKDQLTELLTNYGEITALIIDGWDAPWSRISYDDIPFEEIYYLIKRLQPNCLVMDLNSAKYPSDALFYSDIKSYEQNAGQFISREHNELPALSCLPINATWFWKDSFPTSTVKNPEYIVNNNINPLNAIDCNFILNVAPNRDGLIDDNAKAALKRIGEIWNDMAIVPPILSDVESPIVSRNLAKHEKVQSSWSDDMSIMDFAVDDNFQTLWKSNPEVKQPWFEINFKRMTDFNAITIYDPRLSFDDYDIYYELAGQWKLLSLKKSNRNVKILRFNRVFGEKVKVIIKHFVEPPSIAEIGVYNEIR